MIKIQAIGDIAHPDVVQLDIELKRNDIEPLWNPIPVVQNARAVLLCITSHVDERQTLQMKELMDKYRDGDIKVILPAVFEGGIKPAILADIKPADFTKNPEKALKDLIRAINHFIA